MHARSGQDREWRAGTVVTEYERYSLCKNPRFEVNKPHKEHNFRIAEKNYIAGSKCQS